MQLDQVLFTVAGLPVTQVQLLGASAVLFLAIAVAWWTRRAAYARLGSADPHVHQTLIVVVEVVVALLAALGLGLALHVGGVIHLGSVLQRIHGALNFQLTQVAGTPVTSISALTFLVVLALAFQTSRMVQLGFKRAMTGRGMGDPATIGIAQRLLHYLVVIIGVAVALNVIGIEISGLFAAGAIFAVGIGFAMQTIAQNFVSGVILLVERTIKPGDILEVDGKVLQVREMGIRTTVARTRDDEDVLIPNSNLVQNPVKNYTLLDSVVRVRAPVGVHYDSDLHQVFATLNRAASGVAGQAAGREPVVLLLCFNSSSIDFEVSVWIDDPWRVPRVKSVLLLAIWEALKQDGLVIAYPQVDVHLDPPVHDALRLMAGDRR